jgi:hypothetical protein
MPTSGLIQWGGLAGMGGGVLFTFYAYWVSEKPEYQKPSFREYIGRGEQTATARDNSATHKSQQNS